VSDFQLILLSDRQRPGRIGQPDGQFSFIRFPAEIRMAAVSSVEREIPAEEIAAWYTPIQAYAYAAACVSLKGADNALWQLLKGGMIKAVATSSSTTPKNRSPRVDSKPSFIPNSLWRHAADHGTDLWKGAYARFWVAKDSFHGVPTAYQYFGIKFNPDDIRANLPAPNPIYEAEIAAGAAPTKAAEPAKPTEPHKGGRPRKDFWDDFWIDICGQIYEGNLKPQRQADLEKAMLDWATNHGHELSEATARKAAKKLFNAWKMGG
jgi:hypothetical protein